MRMNILFWAIKVSLFLFVLIASAELSKAAQQTPGETTSFYATGTHQCQSQSDIGHTCEVSGIDFNDCDEALFKLKADDCCPSTLKCSPKPDGTKECRYGGTSIGFTMGLCVPH